MPQVTKKNEKILITGGAGYVGAVLTPYLLEKGYWVFRMGKLVEGPMNIEHKRFLDYACTDVKNDFLDI